jgi:hypothetical protein
VDESSGCIVIEKNVKEEIAPKTVERMFELDFSEKEKLRTGNFKGRP